MGWANSTAKCDLFLLGGGHLSVPCLVALCLPSLLASQCMSWCIALLSPEVRWSEMERLVSLVWAVLHVYSLYRNECPSCGGLWVAFYLGYIAISLRCSAERTLSGRLVSRAAWQFLFSPLCSRMTLSFV